MKALEPVLSTIFFPIFFQVNDGLNNITGNRKTKLPLFNLKLNSIYLIFIFKILLFFLFENILFAFKSL